MKKQKDFYSTWHWLNNHPVFSPSNCNIGGFQSCLSVEVVKVNPITDEIDDDDSKNTSTRVWLECGIPVYCIDMYHKCWIHTHNIALDCGGSSFEEAILELAPLVYKAYGNYAENYEEINFMEKDRDALSFVSWNKIKENDYSEPNLPLRNKKEIYSAPVLVTIKGKKKQEIYPGFAQFNFNTKLWQTTDGQNILAQIIGWMQIPQPPQQK